MLVLSFTVTPEQIAYAKDAVSKCKNYAWSGTSGKGDRAEVLRFYGFLGEVVFADAYGLHRPKDAYGSKGIDNGVDFELNGSLIDIKTIKLSRLPERGEHVIYMVHSAPILRPDCLTDHFFCVGLLPVGDGFTAVFFGSTPAKCLRAGMVGQRLKPKEVANLGHKKLEMHTDSFVFNANQLTPPRISSGLLELPNAKPFNIV